MARLIALAFLSATLALDAQTVTVRSGKGVTFILGPPAGSHARDESSQSESIGALKALKYRGCIREVESEPISV